MHTLGLRIKLECTQSTRVAFHLLDRFPSPHPQGGRSRRHPPPDLIWCSYHSSTCRVLRRKILWASSISAAVCRQLSRSASAVWVILDTFHRKRFLRSKDCSLKVPVSTACSYGDVSAVTVVASVWKNKPIFKIGIGTSSLQVSLIRCTDAYISRCGLYWIHYSPRTPIVVLERKDRELLSAKCCVLRMEQFPYPYSLWTTYRCCHALRPIQKK